MEYFNPQYKSNDSQFIREQQVREIISAVASVQSSDCGVEFQHDSKPIVQWNSSLCKYCHVGAGRLCVWYGRHLEFLQLNYGNHMSVSFDQAHQLLAGEIDESKLVTYVPGSK